LAAEISSGSGEKRLRGLRAAIDQGCDVALGQIFDVTKYENRSVDVRKLLQSSPQFEGSGQAFMWDQPERIAGDERLQTVGLAVVVADLLEVDVPGRDYQPADSRSL
jgi:hypothetical protein